LPAPNNCPCIDIEDTGAGRADPSECRVATKLNTVSAAPVPIAGVVPVPLDETIP
jgi:hypothetical protein